MPRVSRLRAAAHLARATLRYTVAAMRARPVERM
jgi:hypothetical protein